MDVTVVYGIHPAERAPFVVADELTGTGIRYIDASRRKTSRTRYLSGLSKKYDSYIIDLHQAECCGCHTDLQQLELHVYSATLFRPFESRLLDGAFDIINVVVPGGYSYVLSESGYDKEPIEMARFSSRRLRAMARAGLDGRLFDVEIWDGRFQHVGDESWLRTTAQQTVRHLSHSITD